MAQASPPTAMRRPLVHVDRGGRRRRAVRRRPGVLPPRSGSARSCSTCTCLRPGRIRRRWSCSCTAAAGCAATARWSGPASRPWRPGSAGAAGGRRVRRRLGRLPAQRRGALPGPARGRVGGGRLADGQAGLYGFDAGPDRAVGRVGRGAPGRPARAPFDLAAGARGGRLVRAGRPGRAGRAGRGGGRAHRRPARHPRGAAARRPGRRGARARPRGQPDQPRPGRGAAVPDRARHGRPGGSVLAERGAGGGAGRGRGGCPASRRSTGPITCGSASPT